jgi:hypothetical protein
MANYFYAIEDEKEDIVVVALRDIAPDEELLYYCNFDGAAAVPGAVDVAETEFQEFCRSVDDADLSTPPSTKDPACRLLLTLTLSCSASAPLAAPSTDRPAPFFSRCSPHPSPAANPACLPFAANFKNACKPNKKGSISIIQRFVVDQS